ncbi:MAG: HAMP domain-containing sensor histidine kinase [Gaiellales bacterium]
MPAVTVLLLVGAGFVFLAWASARHAVDSAAQIDANRADHYAASIATIVTRNERVLTNLIKDNSLQLDTPIHAQATIAQVTKLASGSAQDDEVAQLVVRANGQIVTLQEPTKGQIETNGIADDLRSFAREVAARNTVEASGVLRLGDRRLYAVGAPIPAVVRPGSAKAAAGAIVAVFDVQGGPIGAFFPRIAGDGGSLSVEDNRHRIVAGEGADSGSGIVIRRIEHTPWRIILAKQQAETFLPTWTYPLFAGLLVLLAIGYAVQEVARRRAKLLSDQRTRQVRSLYELSSGMLHATTQLEQGQKLAVAARELIDVDGAQVTLADAPKAPPILTGSLSPAQRNYRVAITGSHGPVGEILVGRFGHELDEDERRIVQTAAALAGAAMQTAAVIETERAAALELQRLDELRSNLLATVAHELRSPVTAVKGVLGLLTMQDNLPAKSREYVNVAIERTDRLVALIQDLFDCSLLETGQLDIRPQRQLADGLLEAALGAQAAARPGELLLSATENLSITVDPVRFDQMVNNLVTNAFRHGKAPVEVSVRPHDNGVVITVSDEGPGISPDDRDRIFGKFWQGSTGHARLVEGAGLGLSLVQGLVALHGGHIKIDSTHADGRGARFTIWLPDLVPDR